MRTLPLLGVALLTTIHANGQQTSQISATAPITTSAIVPGGTQDIQLHPQGPVGTPFNLTSNSLNPTTRASARAEVSVINFLNGGYVIFEARAVTAGDPQAFSTADANDFMFRLQFPAPSYAWLDVASNRSAMGAGSSLTEVDIGNNGQTDLVGRLDAHSRTFRLPDATTSIDIRVRLAARATGGDAEHTARLEFSLRGRSTIATLLPIGTACTPSVLLHGPMLDGSTRFTTTELAPVVPVMVLGTQNIALPIPPAITWPGCVLHPSPDVILPMTPVIPGSFQSEFILPRISPGVPLVAFIQAVTLDVPNAEVLLSDALRLTWP